MKKKCLIDTTTDCILQNIPEPCKVCKYFINSIKSIEKNKKTNYERNKRR